ncbi:transposase [Pontiellaceae bacterium B1224]|nr:transposase [Pontiellaceae bacterium B1224]
MAQPTRSPSGLTLIRFWYQDVVVMNNLRAHYNEESIKLIEQIGVQVLFLPPYSPHFNPIKKMWSKIKSILRKLEARSPKELSEAITKAFKSVTSDDATGWFISCYITASETRTALAYPSAKARMGHKKKEPAEADPFLQA